MEPMPVLLADDVDYYYKVSLENPMPVVGTMVMNVSWEFQLLWWKEEEAPGAI
jgi:hypothetical protein